MDPDSYPAIFVIDLQDANKKLIRKDENSKRSHKTVLVGVKGFLTIFAY
jgi:hypothetical protein